MVVCISGYFNCWFCECVDFVMCVRVGVSLKCGFAYVLVFVMCASVRGVGFVMCRFFGFCSIWFYVCAGFLKCEYVWCAFYNMWDCLCVGL